VREYAQIAFAEAGMPAALHDFKENFAWRTLDERL
jgi:hypothetical protein